MTGTFHHTAANVVDVLIDGEAEPIGVTDNHPFWSADRQAFVPAGELALGENLRRADGTLAQVTRITPRRGPPVAVYNFEVDAEHVYHVGASGLLVHNSCQVVVIGERMSRVQNAATYLRSQGVNARWYQAWGKFWPKNRALTDDELAANLARNGDWIRQKIRDGYVIVDIGTETPGTFSSPFYLLEKLILDANDYPVVGLGGF